MTANRSVGLEIKAFWADKLLRGEKTIETRGYTLPSQLEGRRIWLLATDGADGAALFADREAASPTFARVVGWVTFSTSSKYENRDAWVQQRAQHCVPKGSPHDWLEGENAELYGWTVAESEALAQPREVPASRRIHRSLRELDCTDADLLNANIGAQYRC